MTFLRQAFFYFSIRIFLRELHHHTPCRSDDLPGQKNILQSERLDLLPVFCFPCEVPLEQQKQIVSQHHLIPRRPTDLQRFAEFWSLMDVVRRHGYIRAAIGVIGRSSVGSGWSLRRHSEYGSLATEFERRLLYYFYIHRKRSWTSILDFQNVSTKLMIGIMYLKYFGQAAYHVLRDATGRSIGCPLWRYCLGGCVYG